LDPPPLCWLFCYHSWARAPLPFSRMSDTVIPCSPSLSILKTLTQVLAGLDPPDLLFPVARLKVWPSRRYSSFLSSRAVVVLPCNSCRRLPDLRRIVGFFCCTTPSALFPFSRVCWTSMPSFWCVCLLHAVPTCHITFLFEATSFSQLRLPYHFLRISFQELSF